MFYALNKVALVLLYSVAAAGLALPLPLSAEVTHWVQVTAAVLLAAHALETVVFFRKVALYPGSVAVSVVLTLLFGFLHWKPLADAARPA